MNSYRSLQDLVLDLKRDRRLKVIVFAISPVQNGFNLEIVIENLASMMDEGFAKPINSYKFVCRMEDFAEFTQPIMEHFSSQSQTPEVNEEEDQDFGTFDPESPL